MFYIIGLTVSIVTQDNIPWQSSISRLNLKCHLT